MATLGLNHVNLRAHRAVLEELKTFYCEVVGLHVGVRPAFPSFGYWLYARDIAIIHLSETTSEAEPQTYPNTIFDHFALNCDDLMSVEATLKQNDVSYRKAVVPLTRQVQLFIQDPAGNKVELNFADINM